MAYQAIEVKNDGAIAWLTLNRPENLNALSALMVEELEDYFHKLPTERGTRVVVMRGAGRAFCAGLDLKEQNRGDSWAGGRRGIRAGARVRCANSRRDIALQRRIHPNRSERLRHGRQLPSA